jgi:hypothetical protein
MAKAAAFAVEGCSPYDGWTARMSPEDRETLFTIAEVAVAFAGFASIVSVLASHAGRDNPGLDATRLRMMLYTSLSATCLCFVPVLLFRPWVSRLLLPGASPESPCCWVRAYRPRETFLKRERSLMKALRLAPVSVSLPLQHTLYQES